MEFRDVSEFRAQAEKCFCRSQSTDDRAAKLHWVLLAEAWLLLSENVGKQDINELFGMTTQVYGLPSLGTRH